MSKKASTGTERVIEFLSEDLYLGLWTKGLRPKKLRLRGGLGEWLLVITATIEGKAQVAFVGSDSILGLARKAHKLFLEDGFDWRDDKFAD